MSWIYKIHDLATAYSHYLEKVCKSWSSYKKTFLEPELSKLFVEILLIFFFRKIIFSDYTKVIFQILHSYLVSFGIDY